MQKYITFLFVAIVILASSGIASAGEFDCQPPILIETRGNVHVSKAILDMQIAMIMQQEGRSYVPPQTQENAPERIQPKADLLGPLFYLSTGMISEDRWFDRRLNWTSYDVNLNFEYNHVGLTLKGAGSDFGRDEFEIFNSHATLYFFAGGRSSSQEMTGFRYGCGITYFYSDPLQGQTFLENRRGAAFIDLNYEGTELKFVALYDDEDFWGGGLIELKFEIPFFKKGVSPTSIVGAFLDTFSGLMMAMVFALPSEFGITGAFGMSDAGDGWGWYMRWRYPIVITYDRLPYAYLKPGFYWGIEFFWGYQGAFGKDNSVSEGWEVGLRIFTFVF